MEQLQEWLNESDSPFCIFNDFVDFDIYPSYRSQVPVGICIELILKRLKNGYYRGYKSLKFDIDLIHKNSLLFNGEKHTITASVR